MTDNQERKSIISIDRETVVPIGLLLAVVGAAITSVIWIGSKFSDLEKAQASSAFERERGQLQLSSEISKLTGEIAALQGHVSALTNDLWKVHDMESWTELLKARNPSLEVPAARKTK